VDVQVAPTLFIQSVLGAALSNWFGFSHPNLRLLTLVLSALLLAVVSALLVMGAAQGKNAGIASSCVQSDVPESFAVVHDGDVWIADQIFRRLAPRPTCLSSRFPV
jgi:hypothetical protein